MITEYAVCYDVHSTSELDCRLNKTVFGGKNTMLNLTGLNEATNYDVAVKAATKIGFGDLGVAMNESTREDSEYIFNNCLTIIVLLVCLSLCSISFISIVAIFLIYCTRYISKMLFRPVMSSQRHKNEYIVILQYF